MKKYVHSLGEGFKTISEVAEAIGMSESAIRRAGEETDTPTYVAPFGRYDIRVYTPGDVETLREHFTARATGGADEDQDREEAEGPQD